MLIPYPYVWTSIGCCSIVFLSFSGPRRRRVEHSVVAMRALLWSLLVVFAVVISPGAKASCAPVVANGVSVDLNVIGTASVSAVVWFEGNGQTYDWSINLCQKVTDAPPGSSGCTGQGGDGYFQEYDRDGTCRRVWSSLTKDWAWNGTAFNAEYTSPGTPNWKAKVGLSCGASPTLAAINDVYASGLPQFGLTFDFQLASSLACPGASTALPPPPPVTTPAPPGPDRCSAFSSGCHDCTSQAGCGWCTSTGKCESGNSLGPIVGTCSNWAWVSFYCPSTPAPFTCESALTCDTCIAGGASCGWCSDSQMCEPGTFNGPSVGSCNTWNWGTCPIPVCSNYTDCDSCNLHSNCGWCTGENTCMDGSSEGPSSANCTGNWTYGSCGATPAPNNAGCSQWASCYDCTESPSGNCGWCADYIYCTEGTSSGPSGGGVCDGTWRWLTSECTTTASPVALTSDCYQFTTCQDCTTGGSDCGWCTSSMSCSSGSSTGPFSGTCSGEWDYFASSCIDPRK